MKKTVVVHIGPHKTGSTAIQAAASENGETLRELGIGFLHNKTTHEAAKLLGQKEFDLAKEQLETVAEQIKQAAEPTILLSQEDFSGNLIGRSGGRKVYPTLTKNMRLIRRSLAPNHVIFVFFLRDEEDWLRSCYAQSVRHRDKLYDLEAFQQHVEPFSWDNILERSRNLNEIDLVTPIYQPEMARSGFEDVLKCCGVNQAELSRFSFSTPRRNVSLQRRELFAFERINHRAFMKKLVPIYKRRAEQFLDAQREDPQPIVASDAPWPPSLFAHPVAGLERLSERANGRVHEQLWQVDLLPDEDVDLHSLAVQTLPSDVEEPDCSRSDIYDQYQILRYHLRGSSELAFLLTLTISYLRRDTTHTGKARRLFHRICRETSYYLLAELSTRWIISTLQTFIDHPENEAQKAIGCAGYFYGNMMKIYEGERLLSGLDPSQLYPSREPTIQGGFRGMDSYHVGGTDLLLNTNALALELSKADMVAGMVLQELLLRTKNSETVFQRHDQYRFEHTVDTPPFSDVWSFFDVPKGWDPDL